MMLVWAVIAFLILLIPLTAIVIDSQLGQAIANRISGGPMDASGLQGRIEKLEAEMRYLSESVESLTEETEFVRSLIEGKEEPPALGSGD
jgi:archaellum component FlaC